MNIKHLFPHHIAYDEDVGVSPANYEYIAVDGEYIILHFRGGSNWNGMTKNYLDIKTAWLKRKLA